MSSLPCALVCALIIHLLVRRRAISWAPAVGVTTLLVGVGTVSGVWLAGAGVVALAIDRRGTRHRELLDNEELIIGVDEARRPVSIPLPRGGGAHTLIVGATGSGKTVTEAWIVARAIDGGHGAVVIDPKGDALLREHTRLAAQRAGRRFLEWTPVGPAIYNPFAHGTPSEIVDKALSGEQFSEPHYLRQAQRYLGHAARTLQCAGEGATPGRLLELMDPRALEVLARRLPDEAAARRVFAYLDGLDARQRTGLAGSRDRLAILSESELGRWLEPVDDRGPQIDLRAAIDERAVVYFRLEADRLPLLARMLAGAVVGDLLTVAAGRLSAPVPTLVVIDEFSAVAPHAVARLFGRARAAGFSMVLATQELADLRAASPDLLDQVLGNVESVIAHRQSVPDSADLMARLAGTRERWAKVEQLEHHLPTGRASRSRRREFLIEPDTIRTLRRGTAAVTVAAAGHCSITDVFHP